MARATYSFRKSPPTNSVVACASILMGENKMNSVTGVNPVTNETEHYTFYGHNSFVSAQLKLDELTKLGYTKVIHKWEVQ